MEIHPHEVLLQWEHHPSVPKCKLFMDVLMQIPQWQGDPRQHHKFAGCTLDCFMELATAEARAEMANWVALGKTYTTLSASASPELSKWAVWSHEPPNRNDLQAWKEWDERNQLFQRRVVSLLTAGLIPRVSTSGQVAFRPGEHAKSCAQSKGCRELVGWPAIRLRLKEVFKYSVSAKTLLRHAEVSEKSEAGSPFAWKRHRVRVMPCALIEWHRGEWRSK